MIKKIPFSLEGLTDLEQSLLAKAEKLKNLERDIAEELAKIGVKSAKVNFASAYLDIGDEMPIVTYEPTPQGFKVVASGKDVLFIEFGAGVYYNSTEAHAERPSNVLGIGEFGDGRGKGQGWFFIGEDGEKHFTRGTPSSMSMYYAREDVRNRIKEVVRRALSD